MPASLEKWGAYYPCLARFRGALYDDDARRVHLVDSRGCLDRASDWDNELHPNSKGFENLATGPWRSALEKYGFA